MKYLWQFYYFFLPQPTLKSDIALRWCRCNGKPYNKLTLAKVRSQELNKDIDDE